MLHTLNFSSVICQLYLNKTGREKRQAAEAGNKVGSQRRRVTGRPVAECSSSANSLGALGQSLGFCSLPLRLLRSGYSCQGD